MKHVKKIFSPTGQPMLSARAAAVRLECAQDYIGKLCREGKLEGTQIKNAWFVDEVSLKVFENSRAASKVARAEALSAERKQEQWAHEYETQSTVERTLRKISRAVPSTAALRQGARALLASALIGALVFGGNALLTSQAYQGTTLGAALGQLQSPFFGTGMQLTLGDLGVSVTKFFAGWFSLRLANEIPPTNPAGQKSSDLLPSPQPGEAGQTFARQASSTVPKTIVQNTYPVRERVVERTLVQSGITQDLLTSQLQQLGNALRTELYGSINGLSSVPPAQGGIGGAIAITQNISKLSGVTLTNATVNGLSGLTADDIPALDYFAATSTISVAYGGTGTSSAPDYGQVLLGNALGGYDLVATSSLGITGSGGTGFSTTSAIYFVNASTTVPKTYTDNIFTGGNIFANSTSTNATTTSLAITGIQSCSSTQALITNASGTVSCGTISGTGGAAFPFTPDTNYGALANSTSTPVWFTAGLQASSTSHFVYASSTALTVSGTGYFGTATTTALNISGTATFQSLASTLLSTNSSGVAQTTTVSAPLSFSGSTLSITQSGAAADGYLSSADWSLFNNKISSSSLSSANGFLTYNSSTGVFTASTTPTYTAATSTNFFATTASSTNLFTSNLSVASLSGLLKATAGVVSTAVAGTDYATLTTVAGAYPFALAGNATSTLTQFNGGLTAYASSTIGSGTQIGGLTVSGGATTTGNAYFAGNVGVGGQPTSRALEVTGTAKVSSTFTLGGVTTCTGSQALQTNGSGDISCGSIAISGASTGGGWTTDNAGHVTLATTTDAVGIGATTTPYAKLSVVSSSMASTTLALLPASSATANIIDFYNTSGALASVFTADHKFGIGSTSPSQALSVQGGALISGGATSTSLGITGLSTALLSTNASGAVVGTSVSSPLAYNGSTLSITQSGAAADGYLASADWNIFNNKISSSSLSQIFPFTPTTNYGAAANSTSTALWFQNGLQASSTSHLVNFDFANATGTAATTTNFFATTASSTNLFASNFSIASLTGLLKATAGVVSTAVAGTDYATPAQISSAFPFTPNTNYGALANSTSTALWFQNGLQASSTSHFVYASSTALTVSGTGYFGTASTSNFTVSNLPTTLLSTNSTGVAQTTTVSAPLSFSGSTLSITQSGAAADGYLASADWNIFNNKISSSSLSQIFPFTPTTNYGAAANSTSTALWFQNGLQASSTSHFVYASSTALTVSGNFYGANLSTCASASDKLLWTGGTFSCGSDAGAAGFTEQNWAFFNGSGVRLGTTTNQVIIGATATSSGVVPLAAFNVIGGAGFDNATTTNLFSTTASSTNLYSSQLGLASSTLGANTKLAVGGGDIVQTAGSAHTAFSTTTASKFYQTVIVGRYAYSAEYAAGLRIMDVSNPKTPKFVGSYTGLTTLLAVAVAGNYAYVGNTDGFYVLDVSNPKNPVQVSKASGVTGFPYAVAVSGRYAYVADYTGAALRVFDISDPRSPVLAGSYLTGGGGPVAVVVSGRYAYIADQGLSQITIVDISNPAAPAKAGQYVTIGTPTGLFVSGKYLYATDSGNGLYIIDAGNVASTTLAALYHPNASDTYYGVAVAGDYAYVGDRTRASLQVLNVSNPLAPFLVGSSTTAVAANSLTLVGKYAYVSGDTDGLAAHEINGADLPSAHIGSLDAGTLNVGTDLSVGGNTTLGGLNVGLSGILSRGAIAAFLASSTQTNPTVASFIGGNVGIGTSSPYAKLSISANTYDSLSSNMLFAISSSTALATTTLFSINNAGVVTARSYFDTSGTTGGYQVDGALVLYASSTTFSTQVGQSTGNTTNPLATYNTLLGYGAGNLITSGANNIVVGAVSTLPNSNITTGSNNILLGYNISLPSATDNSQLNIQNILYGTNNSGSAGTPSTGQLGVGTTSPFARLSVHANNGDTNQTLFAIGSSTQSATTTLFSVNNQGNTSVAGTFAATGNATFAGTLTVNSLCVAADTKLRRRRRRADGSYEYDEVDIINIKAGDEIQSLDEKTGRLVWNRVKQLAYMGVRQTYRITTEDGRTIRTTDNHPYLTRLGWRKVKYLEIGQEIGVAGSIASKWPHTARLNNKTLASQRFWSVALKKFLALADQRVSSEILDVHDDKTFGNGRVEFANVTESVVGSKKRHTMLSRVLENLFVGRGGKSDISGIYQSNGREATQSIAQVAVDTLVREDREHTLRVRDAGENLRWAFENAGGKFDGGINVLFGNPLVLSGNFVEGIAGANEVENIGNSNTRPTDRGFAETDVFVEGDALVHNAPSVAQGAMKTQWTETDTAKTTIQWAKIVSIEPVAEEDVYDIEVEGTHNFIGNGIVAHNTAVFNGGLTSYASSTIGNGTQAGGLTISGGATTTLNAYFGSKVGILNQAPTYALDVAGFINTDQYSGYKQAGNTILYASSTNFATVNGIGAGTNLLTLDGAIHNTALGYQTLNSASLTAAADYNTAVGDTALKANTTGSENTAVGALALLANTTGASNVAVGGQALQSNTTGGSNVSVGNLSLFTNKTGGNNTALGLNASYYNGSATNTVALGSNAAGGAAAYSNQGGTVVGYFAGTNFATGSDYNTLLGYQTGYNVTTGAHNTILGYSGTTGGITTGSDNILIGDDVRNGLTVTASNQLNIGNLLFSNSVGTGATAATGNIGVGTSTPWGKLSVTGAGTGTGVNFLLANSANTPIFKVLDDGSITATGAFTSTATGANTFPYASSTALTVSGHCVTADTRLRRRRKAKKGEEDEADEEGYIYDEPMIKDIEEGDEVQTLDQKTGEFTWSRVNGLVDTGIQPLVRITTQSGKEIDTTAVHPYLVRPKEYRKKRASRTQKLYRFEVDISIKIEDFNRDTVVAIANDEHSFTIEISRKIKQALRDSIRARYPREFAPAVYAAGIVEALKRMDSRVHELVVDLDYYGHDDVIARIVRSAFPRIMLSFNRVGKKSLAHHAAYGVYINKKAADYAATLQDMLKNKESAISASSPLTKESGFESHQALSNITSIFPADEFVKKGVWTRASELTVGQEIAVAYGNTPAWERVVKIEEKPAEQVYDIEVEGTHNFVANGIVAHNTYLSNLLASASSTIGDGTQAGGLTISGGATTTGFLAITGTTGTTTIASGQGFTIGGSQFVLQQGSGHVGIGTTSPNSLGNGLIGGTTPKAFQLDNVGSARAIISSTVSPELWFWNFGAGTDLKGFYTRVDTSGNLITTSLADNYGTSIDALTIAHNGNATFGANVSSVGGLKVTGNVTPTGAGPEVFYLGGAGYFLTYDRTGAAYLPTIIDGLTTTINTGGTAKLTVLGSGNVGIGETAPGSKLSVSGGGSFGSGYDTTAAPTGGLIIQGNVGIGTTTPYSKLSVWGAGTGATSMFELTNSASTSLMTVLNNGNVGIGTTTPASKLSVVGSSYFAGALLATSTVQLTNYTSGALAADSTGALYTFSTSTWTFASSTLLADNNTFSGSNIFSSPLSLTGTTGTTTIAAGQGFTIGSSQFVLQQGSGSVGIGTVAPSDVVHIKGSGALDTANGTFLRLESTGTNDAGLHLKTIQTANTWNVGLANITGQTFYIQEAANPAYFVVKPTTGNVGIGETAPGSKLSVSGGGSFGSGYNTTAAPTGGLIIEGNVGIGETAPGSKLSVSGGGSFGSGYDTTAAPTGGLIIEGNVGIGTTSPSRLLSVSDDGTYSAYFSGRVGIGTNSPITALDVQAALSRLQLKSTTGTNETYMQFNNTGGVGYIGQDNSTGGAFFGSPYGLALVAAGTNPIQLGHGTTPNVTILNSGNVGIGTTTPGSLLSVHGNGLFSGNLLGANLTATGTLSVTGLTTLGNASTTQIGSTGSAYFATIAGNVGIGETAPGSKLSVSGGGSFGSGYDTTAAPTGGLIIEGNVGIGETAPGSKLSVSGGGSFGSGYDTTAAPTGGLIIEGNVGIGMTTPTRRLSIAEGTASTNDAFMSFNNNAERWTIGNNGVGVGGASGNAFVIYGGTTPNYRFVVDSVGNVGIGTTTPVSTLSVQGSLCVRDTGSCGTTAGTIYATTVAITDIDLAENYPAFDGSLVAGEIVALEGTQPSTIKRAVRGETPLGIISTKPGLTLGKEIANSKPVALSGRVPLKVNNEGGSIKIGDHIMLSSVPGVGMAATTSAQTVGIALSAAEFATSTTATIEVFVQSEFTLIQTDRSLLAALGEITSSTVQTLSGSAGDFFTGLTARLAAWLGNAGNGILDLFATRIHAETVYAKELCLGDTCVNEEQLKALLNGSLTSVNTSTSTNMGTSGVQGTSDVQAPTVTLNGNNPATVAVGAAYSDLGAIIADDVDQNLGYTVALDGGTAMDISTLSLDTSVGGTHYIVYSAADQAGNTGTATRTVIVGDGLPAAGVAGDTASSTPSGTSSQQADNFGTGATSATSSPDTVSTTGNLGTGATTTTP